MLAPLIERWCTVDGANETALPGLTFYRSAVPSEPVHCVYEPALCVVAKGAKHVVLGEEIHRYDPGQYLLVSVDLPVTGQVIETPYLGLKVDLAPTVIAEVMLAARQPVPTAGFEPGVGVSPLPPALEEALARLLRLLDTPEDAPTLSPLVMREVVYHLLRGPQSAQLQRMVAPERGRGVMGAVRWLKENYTQPLRVEDLARQVHMSASGLHHHFKAVTAMSPLQYQKQLRLQEARRLLLAQAADAATVSFQVGYNSPSQFSREYARMFGAPPQRDVARLLR